MLKRIEIPVADPGNPDTRSPVRLLVWVGKHQKRTLALGIFFGIWWMLAQALMPFAIGRAIQLGIVEGSNRDLAIWTLALLMLGLMQAFAGVMRHRYAVFNWLQASFRLAQLVAHHAARTGPAVRGALSTGEVVATVSNDAMRAGGAYDITARLSGAVVAYVVVGVILVSSSVVLGLIVLRRRAGARAAARHDHQAAAGAPARPARGGRQADGARRRHRRGPARAARDRRRGRVLRALPPPLAARPHRRHPRRDAAVDARRLPGLHPGSLRRGRDLDRRALRALGEDRHRRADRVLRLRGVPRHPAAHRRPRRSTRSRARSSAPAGC